MSENNGCKCIETIAKKWPEPFHKTILFNQEEGQLKVSEWVVKVYSMNPSGRIKRGTENNLMLNYCPFCGSKLMEGGGD